MPAMDGDHLTMTDPAGIRPFPLILTLDTHGVPHRWISWQHACYYYTKDQVPWTTGAHAFTVYGGMNRITCTRSSITASSIIAIKGKAMASKAFAQVPPLNNRELFHRDRQICAYWAHTFPVSRLTRDHVIPFSRGGKDTITSPEQWAGERFTVRVFGFSDHLRA